MSGVDEVRETRLKPTRPVSPAAAPAIPLATGVIAVSRQLIR